MIKTIERVIDDPRVTVKIAGGARPAAAAPAAAAAAPAAAPATPVSSRPSATPSSVNTELYQALARESKAEWPSAEVTPYLFQAGTDAAAWRSRGIPVYGIYPYPISNDELRRMHGNDERVSVRSLTQGTNMIFRTLVAVAGKR